MRRPRFLLPRLLLAALALTALPAAAQQNAADLSALYWSPEFYSSLLQKVGKPVLNAGQRSVLATAGPQQLASLHNGYSQTVSAEMRYDAVDGISTTLRQQVAQRVIAAEPAQAARVRSALAGDGLWKQFDLLLTGNGYNARNLADVMASYYISSWEVIHQSVAQPGWIRAAHDRIALSLRRSPEIMFMTDIEKQRSAEALGISAAAARTGSQLLAQQRDPVGLVALQEAVYQSLMQQGIDMKRMALDRGGFVQRVLPPAPPPVQTAYAPLPQQPVPQPQQSPWAQPPPVAMPARPATPPYAAPPVPAAPRPPVAAAPAPAAASTVAKAAPPSYEWKPAQTRSRCFITINGHTARLPNCRE